VRAFLLCLLTTCLLLIVACGRQTITGIAVDPAFRTLIPPDTKVLSGVEWDSLKSTPFYQRHEKDLNVPLLNAASERLGIDPLRDISKLVIAWDGTNWIFMERGRFNSSDLQKKIAAAGARSTTYRNHTLLGEHAGTLVFFKTVAVEGSTPAVQRAIDIESAGQGEVPEELQERLRTLSKRDQLWTVSRAGLAFANLPMSSDLQSALSNITGSITGTTAGVYVDAGVHLSIDLQCVSDQGATRVHDALRGIIGFGRLSTKDDQQDLLRAYDAIQVNKTNQIVEVRADLPPELADKLIASLVSLRHSR
jgi:hypothetical protein